jgi:hypothetical protein
VVKVSRALRADIPPDASLLSPCLLRCVPLEPHTGGQLVTASWGREMASASHRGPSNLAVLPLSVPKLPLCSPMSDLFQPVVPVTIASC